MKNLILTNRHSIILKSAVILFAYLLLTTNANGQVFVESDGDVNLGTTSALCPYGYDVYSNGDLYLNGYIKIASGKGITTGGPIYIDPYVNYQFLMLQEDAYGDTGIIPGGNNSCTLGSSSKQFYRIYGYQIYQNQSLVTSDKRKKENIQQIENSLSKIQNIIGYKYDLKSADAESIKSPMSKSAIISENKNHIGFLAQDIKDVIPEAVVYDEENDSYYLDYNAFIPVLVEALKEQQNQINELNDEVSSLKELAYGATGLGSNSLNMNKAAILGPNVPNPFDKSTSIDMNIPTTVNNAKLYIYNMQGKQVNAFTINKRGNTSLTIDGYELEAGMYLYTLITDGKEVDTKKMILTK